jgi:hypothetical protein
LRYASIKVGSVRVVPGRAIVIASWLGNAVFACTAIPAAAGVDALETPALIIELTLFFASIVVWLWAFGAAVVRSAQGDEIVVANLFLVQGDVPRAVRIQLFASVILSVAIAAGTAAADPFGVLVPMLPLGLCGLWGARHGSFPARRDMAR